MAGQSDDVWEAARIIWENTPKISDRELLERLIETFGERAPKAHTAIYKRRKKENWQKNETVSTGTEAETKGTDEGTKTPSGNKKPKNTSQSLEKSSENNKGTDEGTSSRGGNTGNNSINQSLILWQHTEQKIKAEAERIILDAKEKAKIVLKHRRRIGQLGALQETVLDTLNNLQHLDPEFDGEKVAQVLGISDASARVLRALTDSQESIFKQEMTVCGITMADFEMSEQDRRMAGLAALEGIADEEAQMRQTLKAELTERLAQIETMTLDDVDLPPVDDWDEG